MCVNCKEKKSKPVLSENSLEIEDACMHPKLLQSCPTLCNPMDCSLPGSSVHGILQARIQEWVAMPSSRGIFLTQGSNSGLLCFLHWQMDSLPLVPPEKSKIIPLIIYTANSLVKAWSIPSDVSCWMQLCMTMGHIFRWFSIYTLRYVKVLHSICQKIWKTQQWPQDWKRSAFIPIPKKGNAKECSSYHTIALISHASKVMLKILQARLQQNVNHELPDVQAGFRKGRGKTAEE